MLHGTDFEVRYVHTVTVFIFFKKVFLWYDQADIGNNLLLFVGSFYASLGLSWRYESHENVNFTTRCFILG